MHMLQREIILNVPAQDLWTFIATPRNLNRITPPELNFRIISTIPEQMFNGLTILYEIRVPVFGRKLWLTEIKHIREGVSFVDEQLIGPYRLWYHYHEVSALSATQTRMLDQVHYRLPFGPLGIIVQQLRVGRMLDAIFAYRAEKLKGLFP